MADVDLHIKGGTVVDGTRVPSYWADVWIKDGKIAQIGGRAPGFAKRTIGCRPYQRTPRASAIVACYVKEPRRTSWSTT